MKTIISEHAPKSLIFDTGPIISLTMNNLLWLLKPLKEQFQGEFIIPRPVKRELVDKPLNTKKFKFEAFQVLYYMNNNILFMFDNKNMKQKSEKILSIANKCFKARGNFIQIIHYAEAAALANALELKAEAVCIDERTTRLLIENPNELKKILMKKLHTNIKVNHHNLKQIKKKLKGIKIIRSAELVTMAYELGLLDIYLKNTSMAKKELLDSVLWGVKLDGCAISGKEIDQIIKLEKR